VNQQISRLIKKLSFLGYGSFAITSIINEIVSTDNLEAISPTTQLELIEHLELYEQLGTNFLQAYSK
jgi:hypothetical protein